MVLHNEILAALAQHLAVRLGALGLASGAAVLEPHLYLPGLHPQLHRQRALLMRVRPLQPFKRLLQVPQLCLGESQLLARPCIHIISTNHIPFRILLYTIDTPPIDRTGRLHGHYKNQKILIAHSSHSFTKRYDLEPELIEHRISSLLLLVHVKPRMVQPRSNKLECWNVLPTFIVVIVVKASITRTSRKD